MSTNKMKNCCFMHNHGSKLYGIRTTGHVLCATDIVLYGLKPSVANPSLMLRLSTVKLGFYFIKSFPCRAVSRMPQNTILST